MNADLVSKSLTNAVLLSFSWYSRLISYQLSAKGSFSRTCVPAATYYKPFWNLLPPPLHSFSDIAHFRMDRMSQPLYWPSERPAERTCPEWAVGGWVVCGGVSGGSAGSGLRAVPVGRAKHRRGREAGWSPRTSMQQQQGRAPALVTPGSCRWASWPFEPREQLHLKAWAAHSSIGSKTKSTEATS